VQKGACIVIARLGILRVAPQDMELGGYSILKGEKLWIPVLSIHNSSVNFSEVGRKYNLHALARQLFLDRQDVRCAASKRSQVRMSRVPLRMLPAVKACLLQVNLACFTLSLMCGNRFRAKTLVAFCCSCAPVNATLAGKQVQLIQAFMCKTAIICVQLHASTFVQVSLQAWTN